MTLVYSPDHPVSQSDLLALYGSVGWSSYTRDPAGLHRAVAGSLWRMGAWDGPELVGLVRAVGDDVSIAYVQDVLVRPDRQRRGIGARLLAAALPARRRRGLRAVTPRAHCTSSSGQWQGDSPGTQAAAVDQDRLTSAGGDTERAPGRPARLRPPRGPGLEAAPVSRPGRLWPRRWRWRPRRSNRGCRLPRRGAPGRRGTCGWRSRAGPCGVRRPGRSGGAPGRCGRR